jgi:hypothetical protein
MRSQRERLRHLLDRLVYFSRLYEYVPYDQPPLIPVLEAERKELYIRDRDAY